MENQKETEEISGSGSSSSGGQGQKRKAEEGDEKMPVDIGEVMCLVQSWVQEVQDQMIEDYEEKVWEEDFAEDGGPAVLPWELVLEARKEEIGFMVKKKIGRFVR